MTNRRRIVSTLAVLLLMAACTQETGAEFSVNTFGGGGETIAGTTETTGAPEAVHATSSAASIETGPEVSDLSQLEWLTNPLLSALSAAPPCGSEGDLVAWASSVKPGFPVDAASAPILEAGRLVPLMSSLDPACVTAVVGGEFAAWSSESIDGSVLVRGVAGPFEAISCYTDPDGSPSYVAADAANRIGSGHLVGYCDFEGTGTVVGGTQLSVGGPLQRFLIEFGPAFTSRPLVAGEPADPAGDVLRRLGWVGELETAWTKWLGSVVPYNWHTGYAPCSTFYTETAPARTRALRTIWVMDFCDADNHIGLFVASNESLIPTDATLTDLGRTVLATWSTADGIWSVATIGQTQHGFLSVHGADASVSVDDLARVLAASPTLHLGVLPSLQP